MKFYRYDTAHYADKVTLSRTEFDMVKETPKGWHIVQKGWPDKHWVSKTSTKRHAYPTKEEAMTSFVARKRRQIKILTAQLETAELGLKMAENGTTEEFTDMLIL